MLTQGLRSHFDGKIRSSMIFSAEMMPPFRALRATPGAHYRRRRQMRTRPASAPTGAAGGRRAPRLQQRAGRRERPPSRRRQKTKKPPPPLTPRTYHRAPSAPRQNNAGYATRSITRFHGLAGRGHTLSGGSLRRHEIHQSRCQAIASERLARNRRLQTASGHRQPTVNYIISRALPAVIPRIRAHRPPYRARCLHTFS